MITGIVLFGIGLIGIVGLYALYRRATRTTEELPSAEAIPWLADKAEGPLTVAPVLDFLTGRPLDMYDAVPLDIAVQMQTGRTELVPVMVSPYTAALFREKGIAPFAEALRNMEGRSDAFCVRGLGTLHEDITAGYLYDLIFADAVGDDFDAKIAVMQGVWETERLASLETEPEVISDEDMDALFEEMMDVDAKPTLDTLEPTTDTTEEVNT